MYYRLPLFSKSGKLFLMQHNTKKASTFQLRPIYSYIFTLIKRWFQPFGLHTRCLTNSLSAISFCLPPASISAAASSGSPLSSTFVSDFSRPSIPRLMPLPFRFLTPSVSAFFRPLQFWVLTTQPLFFFSFSSRFRLTVAFPVPVSALASSVSSFSPT